MLGACQPPTKVASKSQSPFIVVIKLVFQMVCLTALFPLVCAYGYGWGHTEGSQLLVELKTVLNNHCDLFVWAGIITLQLGAMKWIGAIWNILFNLLSIISIACITLLATQAETAVTSPSITRWYAMDLAATQASPPQLCGGSLSCG